MADKLIFDIETGPIAEPHLSAWLDQELEAYANTPGVKRLTNKKDEKIAEKRLDLLDRAALSALSGRVLAIGYMNLATKKKAVDCVSDGSSDQVSPRSEVDLLNGFWKKVADRREQIGFNIKGFDLPFLVRRSYILGVDVPADVFNGRHFSDLFTDLLDRWRCGNNQEYVSLDSLCRACNCGAKPDDVDGATFAAYFLQGGEKRAQAIAYALNDLDMTAELAERMGV